MNRSEQSRLPLVYIAGPIHGSGKLEMNLVEAIRAAEAARSLGATVVVPHLNVLWNMMVGFAYGEAADDYWLENDGELLRRCDAMLRLPGRSPGADFEEGIATAAGIPVVRDVDRLESLLGELAQDDRADGDRADGDRADGDRAEDAEPQGFKVEFEHAFNDMQAHVHSMARSKGWHEGKVTHEKVGSMIALIMSELAEALEEVRGHEISELCDEYRDDMKPQGFPSEMADAVIRCMDLCGLLGVDLGRAITSKVRYNASREYRHGGKRL